ncbi:MAG: 16S rRNA processing protein RimM [FCB group bacterium]|nr:16S rRNA processing protein RimM [FCB group bacterium]
MSKLPEYIIVGCFGRPRGLSGEINITPETDDPERFLELDDVYVVIEGQRRRLHLESAAVVGSRPVVKVEGYNSREEVARLTNLSIEIPMALARELPEGSYYQFELVGCQVIGIDGVEYGVIEEVLLYPANDLYRIKSDKFGEILFPVVDRFIVKVDIDKKTIIIDPPDGWIEINKD